MDSKEGMDDKKETEVADKEESPDVNPRNGWTCRLLEYIMEGFYDHDRREASQIPPKHQFTSSGIYTLPTAYRLT